MQTHVRTCDEPLPRLFGPVCFWDEGRVNDQAQDFVEGVSPEPDGESDLLVLLEPQPEPYIIQRKFGLIQVIRLMLKPPPK